MREPRKLKKQDIEKMLMLRGELTKVRCWHTGFEHGTGKLVPGLDGIRQTIMLFDELTKE